LNSKITLGELTAPPSQTTMGIATYVELRDGSKVGLPAIIVNGKDRGPRVVVTAATHPTELIGVAAVQVLAKILKPEKIRGTLIMFPVSNPLGMQFGEYTSPHDGVNMSTAYPGDKSGSPSYRLANFIWSEAVQDADLVMDFHENAKPCLSFSIVGYSEDLRIEEKTLELAKSFGLTVIRSGKAKFTLPGVKPTDKSLADFCLSEGIAAFTPEFEGGPELWTFRNEGSVAVAVRGVLNVLKRLKIIDGKVEPQSGIKVMEGNFEAWGIAHSNRAGFVDRLVETGAKIRKGEAIARILDPFGIEREKVLMPVEGYLWGWTAAGGSNRRHLAVHAGGNVAYVFKEVEA
jgi:predicted deacylase